MATDMPLGESSEHPTKTFESSRVASAPDGWITTNGVFFPCSPQEHDECAEYLLKTHKSLIESLLRESEHYGMIYSNARHSPRTILQAAGFALLSGNQLSESNLPESLSFLTSAN